MKLTNLVPYLRSGLRVPGALILGLLAAVVPHTTRAAFAYGADASWYTQMVHDSGYTFFTQSGTQEPCLNVLQSVGINAIRLRVWVNPAGGWCGQSDTVTKAVAAQALGQEVMIDFHYSDTWASGNTQTPPAAWTNYNLSQMESAVASHTSSVLNALKSAGVTVSWVQIGNEINDGMLFPLGGVNGQGDNSWSNLAGLINAGYNAAKSVFPSVQCIIHLANGQDTATFTSFFNNLKAAGGKFDAIGMSAYPYWANLPWQIEVADVMNTVKTVKSTFGVPTMIVECGYQESDPTHCFSYLTALIAEAQANGVEGAFYWEPECYGNWPVGGAYALGAFTNGTSYGRPNTGMNAFYGGGVGLTNNGIYTVINRYSGMALDNGSSTTNGAYAVQWTMNAGNSQAWKLVSVGTNLWELISQYSSKALDNGSTKTVGASVMQWTTSGGTQQQWWISNISGNNYWINSNYSGMNLDNGSSLSNGSHVIQYTNGSGVQQQWMILPN